MTMAVVMTMTMEAGIEGKYNNQLKEAAEAMMSTAMAKNQLKWQ